MERSEPKQKADILAAKLWRLLGNTDWMKRLTTTQHHADWQTIATAVDRRYPRSVNKLSDGS